VKGNNIHTKEIFERAYGNRDWNWYRYLVAECIKYGMPGKWLDLGAGLGLFVECARRFGIACIGLEGSEWAVSEAKKRFPNMDIRQHFLEDELPFRDNSISTIMCHQVIEHIHKETTTFILKECYRVLGPEGRLFIYSPSKYDRNQRSKETHINLYTPKLLKMELENIGFRVIASPNSPRNISANFQIGKYIMQLIYKLFPLDYLSATANCIAVKSW